MRSVLFVCLGNICRSPMAEGIARSWLAAHDREDVRIDSAGTSSAHGGEEADPRTLEVLARHGIVYPLRSRQVVSADFSRFDLILAMDCANLRDLTTRCPERLQHRLHLVLTPTSGGEVPDPYYGGAGGFDRVYAMLDEAVDRWLSTL